MSAAAREARFAQAPETIARELDGEVLLVPVREQLLDLDDCFHLLEDSVSVRLWGLLARERTLEELVRAVTAEFEVTAEVARADVARFLDELVRIGAARRTDPAAREV